MTHGRRLLLGLCAAALPLHAAWAAPAPQQLTLVNAAYPPFVNAPGHPRGEGIDIEIAREALRRGGAGRFTLAVEIVPWRRALFMLEHGTADFTTTSARTPERERFLDWSGPYRVRISYRFYSRKGADVQVKHLPDLARYRLGLSAGFFYPAPILAQTGTHTEQAKDIAGVVKLLQAGRVELIVLSNYAGVWEIREQGVADQLQAQPFEYANKNAAYMAFSRARDNTEARAAMTAGLTAMLQDGSVARIERKYLLAH